MLLLPPGVAPSSVTRLSRRRRRPPRRAPARARDLPAPRRAVLAMTYAHPRIELAVSADERHLQLLRGRLENAIDVLEVNYGV